MAVVRHDYVEAQGAGKNVCAISGCESQDFWEGDTETADSWARVKRGCCECGAEWNDTYELHSAAITKWPEPKPSVWEVARDILIAGTCDSNLQIREEDKPEAVDGGVWVTARVFVEDE